MRHIRRNLRIPFLILAGLLLMAAGGLAWFTADRGRIEPGLRIAGVDVGGLTPAEAEQRLAAALQGQQPTGRTLAYRGQTWEVAASKLGLALDVARSADKAYRLTRPGGWWKRLVAQVRVRRSRPNLPMPVRYDETAVRAMLARLKKEIDQAPTSARLELFGNRVEVEPDRSGWALNVDATVAGLMAQDHLPLLDPVRLVVEETPAPVRTAELRPMTAILGQFTTDLANGYYGIVRRNRRYNVRLAASKFDRTLLRPGETFSFNQLVGPREAPYGYRIAPVFTLVDGANEVRDEVGGGICQCATTVYNAALLANLKILERRPHSKIVHYARAARDATVYFGLSDLRFRNVLSHPVAVFARVWGYKFTVTIVGYPEDQFDVDLSVARGGGGYHLTRTVKRDGVQIARELVNTTVYNWREKPKPPPVKPLKKATPAAPQPGTAEAQPPATTPPSSTEPPPAEPPAPPSGAASPTPPDDTAHQPDRPVGEAAGG